MTESPVATCPHVDGPLALAPVLHSVGEGRLGKRARGLQVTVVRRPPAAAVDVDDVLPARERRRLHRVGIGVEHAEPDQARGGRRARDADAVEAARRRHARAGRAVVVAGAGTGVGVVVHPVPALAWDHVGRQVLVVDLQAIVDDRHHLAVRTLEPVPHRRDVDIGAGSAAALAGVAQVPLVGEQRVVGDRARRARPPPVGRGPLHGPAAAQLVRRRETAPSRIGTQQAGVARVAHGLHRLEPVGAGDLGGTRRAGGAEPGRHLAGEGQAVGRRPGSLVEDRAHLSDLGLRGEALGGAGDGVARRAARTEPREHDVLVGAGEHPSAGVHQAGKLRHARRVTPEPGWKNTANSSAASHADSGREPSYHV